LAGLLGAGQALAQVIAPAIPVASTNTRYIKAVHAALELLRSRAPQDFEFARRHVALVREVERSTEVGMSVRGNPPAANLRRQEVMGISTSWLAGVLVHEACHRFQYVRGMERHASEFPPRYEYSGRIAELECLKLQAEALERVKAPEREVKYVREQDGRHYLRNAFGSYYEGHGGWDPSNEDPREKAGAAR
jgi:hypothetical protein